jgi:hypothetical protein
VAGVVWFAVVAQRWKVGAIHRIARPMSVACAQGHITSCERAIGVNRPYLAHLCLVRSRQAVRRPKIDCDQLTPEPSSFVMGEESIYISTSFEHEGPWYRQ